MAKALSELRFIKLYKINRQEVLARRSSKRFAEHIKRISSVKEMTIYGLSHLFPAMLLRASPTLFRLRTVRGPLVNKDCLSATNFELNFLVGVIL